MATVDNIFFVEKVAFMALLDSAVAAESVSVAEPLVKKMCDIVAKYQEQPHLLDPHMEAIVFPVMARVRTTLRAWHEKRATTLSAAPLATTTSSSSSSSSTSTTAAIAFGTQVYENPILHQLLTLIYVLCKTRGYKHIVKLFPHEVADVEPCVQALLCQDTASHDTWETRYVLLLWLSILVLIPFDLATVDSHIGGGGGKGTSKNSTSVGGGGGRGIISSILHLCKGYLADPGAVREAGAVCIARLLTRPDMDRAHLRIYCTWAADALSACTAKEVVEEDVSSGLRSGVAGGSNIAVAGGAGKGAVDDDDDDDDDDEDEDDAEGKGAATSSSASASATSILPSTLSASSRIFLATGILTSLVNVAKFGHREVLLEILGDTFSRVSAISGAEVAPSRGSAAHRNTGLKASPLLRKLTVKLAARTGLTFLPPRVVNWRYQRGSRSLLENLSLAGVAAAKDAATATMNGGATSPNKRNNGGSGPDGRNDHELFRTGNAGLTDITLAIGSGNSTNSDSISKNGVSSPKSDLSTNAAGEDVDEDGFTNADIPPELEDIIDMLLQGLRDSDTVVRWSAAKGVGRVTGRLPRDFADDVVAAVLELLQLSESDGAWHGGCLALAELARRGLLLPTRLPEVVPLVLQALQYDVRRGAHSVGQHVRDAACYVCWAFARAYAPGVMRPHVLSLAQGMLTTALFDREVNCRRAASAAFQENVGRQGHENFPNGIAILTAADYFTLGNRTNAFLSVAPIVASFPQYRMALCTHLLDVKLKHWDKDVRELAAKSLARMTLLDPGWVIQVAIPKLLPLTVSADLFIRHGATLGIAEFVLALSAVPIHGVIPTFLIDEIRNVVVKAEKARVYTGRGGEIVRAAMCRLIECQCLAGHVLSRKAALRLLQTIDDCLKHPSDMIQAHAVAALKALTVHALGEPETAVLDRVTRTYVTKMKDDNPAVRRGTALAIGALPKSLLYGKDLDAAVNALCKATQPEKQAYKRDAESRRNAAIGLGDLVATVGFGKQQMVTIETLVANGLKDTKGSSSTESSSSSGTSGSTAVTTSVQGTNNSDGLTPAQVSRIWDALLDATRDYATDNRGDVGSWVRKAAVESMERILMVLQAHVWHITSLSSALSALSSSAAAAAASSSSSTSSSAAVASAVEDVHVLISSDPVSAAGGGVASLDAVQHASGYGNITGYEAGIRLLGTGGTSGGGSSGNNATIFAARVGATVTTSGIQVGRSVLTSYGPGVLMSVSVGGTICEIAFPRCSLGAACFPYNGTALLRVDRIQPLNASTGEAATSVSTVVLSTSVDAVSMLKARFCDDTNNSRATPRLVRVPVLPVDASTSEATSAASLSSLYINDAMVLTGMCALLRQAGEKLDLLRAVAGDAVCRLLYPPKPLPRIHQLVQRKRLEAIFPEPAWSHQKGAYSGAEEDFGQEDAGAGEDNDGEGAVTTTSNTEEENNVVGAGGGGETSSSSATITATATTTTTTTTTTTASITTTNIQWAIPHQCFPRIVGLLGTPEYTFALLEGLVTSVGGLSESVVKHSSAAVSAWAIETAKNAARVEDLALVAQSLQRLVQPRPRLAWESGADEGGESGSTNAGSSGSGGGSNGVPPPTTAASVAAGFDPSLQRWYKEIIGSSMGGGGGSSNSSNSAAASRAAASKASSSTTKDGSGSLDINTTHRVDVRVIVPALRTAEVLLAVGALDALVPPTYTWASDMLILVRRRVSMAREDVARVLAAGSLYLGLLHFTQIPIRAAAVTSLLDLLCHPFPRVRKTIAEKLYIRLLTLDDVIAAEHFDAVMAILTETPWESSLEALLPIRDTLYAQFQVKMPETRMGMSAEDISLSKGQEASGGGRGGESGGAGSSRPDEYTSYGALARDAGY